MSDTAIGFIGLGTMGGAMAKNLLEAAYAVIGYDREDDALTSFVENGGQPATSVREIAAKTDVILTSLPNSAAVSEVVAGDNGILNELEGGETVIDLSTTAPSVTRELAEKVDSVGASMLDAPVSGGEAGAIDGSLTIMIGGDKAVLAEHRDLLMTIGGQLFHCGEAGAGQVTKACNQIVVANAMQAVSEALVFAEMADADLETVIDVLQSGAASCWTLEHRAPRMIRGDFEPGFFASYQLKDLRIATDAGMEVGAPMPITSMTTESYKSMVNTGLGLDDNAGVIQILERMAGTQARIE